MDITDIARKVFADDRYATELTGVKIVAVGEHEATCTLTINAGHCNARGVVMGGALYTLADFCAAVAANSDLQTPLQWVSLDATIHYLAPAQADAVLKAHSTSLKHGRTTALYQTIIENLDSGKVVAVVETSMVKV